MTRFFTYREINNVHLFMNEESLVASPIMRLTNVGIIAQNINIFFFGGGDQCPLEFALVQSENNSKNVFSLIRHQFKTGGWSWLI